MAVPPLRGVSLRSPPLRSGTATAPHRQGGASAPTGTPLPSLYSTRLVGADRTDPSNPTGSLTPPEMAPSLAAVEGRGSSRAAVTRLAHRFPIRCAPYQELALARLLRSPSPSARVYRTYVLYKPRARRAGNLARAKDVVMLSRRRSGLGSHWARVAAWEPPAARVRPPSRGAYPIRSLVSIKVA